MLLVIGFHAFPEWIPGGFVGVDVFFVISGFLITGIILREVRSKKFSFSIFYGRRIRRIFPALIVVLVFSFAIGWWSLLPGEYKFLGINLFGGAAFSSNLVLLHEIGYFDVAATRKPLLHLWSLGIEEQFYVCWPVLLLVLARWRLGVLLLVGLIGAASFTFGIVVLRHNPAAAFYLPFSRAWELMIGGLLAWYQERRNDDPGWQLPSRTVNTRALLGMAFVVLAAGWLDKRTPFPGWPALLPTLGALLILSTEQAWLNRRFFSGRIPVKLGLISYPLYLWHWPLLSFAAIAAPQQTAGIEFRLIAILTSLIFAWLTYRYIERPLREGRRAAATKIACLCAGMAVIGAIGLLTFERQGFAFRVPKAIRQLATIADHATANWRSGKCFIDSSTGDATASYGPGCLPMPPQRPLLFLWGDSYAASLYPGLVALASSEGFSIAQFTSAGCPPVLSFVVETRPHCVDDNNFVLAKIAQAQPDVILLYSIWTSYAGLRPDNLDKTVAALRAAQHGRIVLMGPPPLWAQGLPQIILNYYNTHRLDPLIPRRTHYGLAQGVDVYDRQFRQKAAALGIGYISAWKTLCNADGCLTRVGSAPADITTFDYGHLTLIGAKYLAREIVTRLFPELGGATR